MTYDFLDSLYDDIMLMLKHLVVKREDQAIENQNLTTIREWEEYMSCIKGERNIYNFIKLDREVLSKFVPSHMIDICMSDRRKIPSDVLDGFISAQMQYKIDHYVEHNEYYRMLNGQPTLDDLSYIYINGYGNIPNNIPIHMMSIDQIAFLEIKGVLKRLQQKYPEKRYLKYLGPYKIDLIDAHQAKPYQILYLGHAGNYLTEELFRHEYHKARRFVMIEIHNKYLYVDRPMYEPMVGLMITFLAIRNTLVPNEATYLNFEEILNAILESYGILQYFENLPFTYKKRLVLALDKLYQHKGTDGVLLDICQLFLDETLTAKRYYFLKTNAKDQDGNLIMSDDPNRKYDLNFLTVDVRERDIDVVDSNIIDYETITSNDYLWQLTSEELEKFKGEEFNLWMSKYISVEAAYDLSQLTYEVCFFINLLLSARNNIGGIRVSNMYALEGESDCFTMLMFMLALFSKRAEYDGNIVFSPKHIAELWRFNLDDMTNELREMIQIYDLPKEIEQIFFDTTGKYRMQKPSKDHNANEIISIYVNNRDIFDELQKAMINTRNYRHYIALSRIKKCLFQSCLTIDNFTKSNGEIASTYLDMLQDLDYTLYHKVETTAIEDIDKILLYVMEKMEYMFSHSFLHFLFINTPNTSISLLSKYIRTTVEVFKASSVQLDTINIFFYIGDKFPEVRVFDDIELHKTKYLEDIVHVVDELVTHKTILIEDVARVNDRAYPTVNQIQYE